MFKLTKFCWVDQIFSEFNQIFVESTKLLIFGKINQLFCYPYNSKVSQEKIVESTKSFSECKWLDTFENVK